MNTETHKALETFATIRVTVDRYREPEGRDVDLPVFDGDVEAFGKALDALGAAVLWSTAKNDSESKKLFAEWEDAHKVPYLQEKEKLRREQMLTPSAQPSAVSQALYSVTRQLERKLVIKYMDRGIPAHHTRAGCALIFDENGNRLGGVAVVDKRPLKFKAGARLTGNALDNWRSRWRTFKKPESVVKYLLENATPVSEREVALREAQKEYDKLHNEYRELCRVMDAASRVSLGATRDMSDDEFVAAMLEKRAEWQKACADMDASFDLLKKFREENIDPLKV